MVKKFLIFAASLAVPILVYGAAGDSVSVVVSSGSYYSIETASTTSANLRQVIVIGDPSTTKRAPVDSTTGLVVQLATSSASGIGSLSAGTAEIGNVKNSGTFATQSSQSGVWGSTVSFNGVSQPVSQGSVFGATVTFPTPQAVNSTPVGITTVTFNGTAQPVSFTASGISTVTFNGTSQPVSQGSVWGATVTFPSAQSVNATPVGITTVTFNGTGQPVTQSGVWTFSPPAITTVTFNGTSQPVSQGGVWGATVTFPSAQAVNATPVGTSTVTFNSIAQPVNATPVGTSTVTFNGTAQPVNATPVGLSTVTFNGTSQPMSQGSVWGATVTFPSPQQVTPAGIWGSTVSFNNVLQPVAISTQIISTANAAIVVVSTFANVSASQTDQILVSTLTATNRICVHGYSMVTGGTATNVTFNTKPTAAGTAIWYLVANGANGGINSGWSPAPWFCTNAGDSLSVTTGAGSTTGIGILYGKE